VLATKPGRPAVTRARIAWLSALALVAAMAVPFTREMPFPFGVSSIDAPSAIDLAAPPVCLAAGAVACVQALAALVGRGRPAPGARVAPFVRALLVGFVAALEVHWLLVDQPVAFFWGAPLRAGDLRFATAAALGGTALLAAMAILVGKAGGGSVATPAALALAATRIVHMPGSFRLPTFVVLVVPVAIGAGGLRLLRLDRARLERSGVTPWSPGDLAILPLVYALVAVAAGESVARGSGILRVLDFTANDLYHAPWLIALPFVPPAAVVAWTRARV
jgi:hypothetical protein